MILVCRAGLSADRVQEIRDVLRRRGLESDESRASGRVLLTVEESTPGASEDLGMRTLPGVEAILPTVSPHPLADPRPDRTTVRLGEARIGDGSFAVIAGPCAVENREMLLASARAVKEAGGDGLRGGAYKPRTSPYSFRGLGEEGLKLLAEAKEATGLPIVTEVLDPRDLPAVLRVADVLQVGSRNMTNAALLREVGGSGAPILLKRGMASTVKEFLLAAEAVLGAGAEEVVLCERGIRSFDPGFRNLLDLTAVAALRQRTHLPVVADPSHGTGRADLVPPLAMAAAAAGADGLLVEVHPAPETARSDGPQALRPDELGRLVDRCRRIANLAREEDS
jgi:3-deoxy-7-phosphoheptulonate synthase